MPTTAQFPSTIQLSNLNGQNGFKLDGETANDQAGYALGGAGDVNGDGFADIFIGAPYFNGGTSNGVGRSYVVFGGNGTISGGDFSLTSLNGANGFKMNGENTGDACGYAGAITGDINGDGYADIIIGAPYHASSAGRVYVVYGGKNIVPSGLLSLASLNGTNGYIMDGEASNDRLGFWVNTAGDVNSDGFCDLVIGAPRHNGGSNGVGRGYLIYGSNRTVSGGIFLLSSLNGTNGYKMDGEASGDHCGFSANAAGDVNGDHYNDLLISAIGHAGSTGRSYVVFGGKNIVPGGLLPLSSLNGTYGFKIDGESTGDESGYQVSAAGDINGDSFADVLIGSPYYSANSAGRAYVVYGGSAMVSGGLLSLSNLNGANGFKIDGQAANDDTGEAVNPAGDVNHDGYADLLVGTDQQSSGIGRTYVIFGGQGLGAGGILSTSSLNGSNGFTLSGESNLDLCGSTLSIGGDINGDSVSDFIISASWYNSNAGRSYVVFGSSAVWVNNGLTIHQGEVVPINTANLTASGPRSAAFVFVISNISHGQFELVSNPGVPVTNFTQQQITVGAIQFRQDGSSQTPGYSVGVNTLGFAFLPPNPAQVTFFPLLLQNNAIAIHQGQQIPMTSANLNVTSPDLPSQINLTISNCQHGQFQLLPLNNSVTQFTQQQILNGVIWFTQDNSSTAPSYEVSASASGFTLPPAAANVTFYRRAVWNINQLIIHQNETLTFNSADLNVTDDYPPNQIIFTMSNLQHGQFLLAPNHVSVTQFSRQQMLLGDVTFAQDGGVIAPSYQVNMTDGYDTLSALPANVTFYRAPVILNNQLTIHQSEAVLITPGVLTVNDDYPTNQVVFTVNSVQQGQFLLAPNNISVTQFTQQQLQAGDIYFEQNGAAIVPSYQLMMTDGYFNLTIAANITFFRKPVLTHNFLMIHEGESVLITPPLLDVADDYPPSEVNFTISGLQHGQFTLLPLNNSVMQFTQAQLSAGNIVLTHDNTVNSPAYQISVNDPYFTLSAAIANITFYRQLMLVNNQLSLHQGQTVFLNSTQLSVLDGYPATQVQFTVTNLQHGQFFLSNGLGGTPVSQFTEQELLAGGIFFTQDGSLTAPSYDISVSDPYFTVPPTAAAVAYIADTPPTFLHNELLISTGQTKFLSTADLSAADTITPQGDLVFAISNLAHGYFALSATPGLATTNFTQQQIIDGQVEFIQDGTNQAPAYAVTVTDGFDLSTGPMNANITFNGNSPNPPSNPPSSTSSNTVRDTIIGAVLSGVIGLGFFALRVWMGRRAQRQFDQAIAEEDGVGRQQADYRKNVIRPIAKEILERIQLAGCMGNISNMTMKEAIGAISMIVYELNRQGVEVDLRKLSDVEQHRLLDTVARQTRRLLVPDVGCCSPTRLSRFFCAEVTPQQIETNAVAIASAVKAFLGRGSSSPQVELQTLTPIKAAVGGAGLYTEKEADADSPKPLADSSSTYSTSYGY